MRTLLQARYVVSEDMVGRDPYAFGALYPVNAVL